MKSINPLDAILAVIGSIMVYGAANILKLVKAEITDKRILILKLSGLAIAAVGLFRIIYS